MITFEDFVEDIRDGEDFGGWNQLYTKNERSKYGFSPDFANQLPFEGDEIFAYYEWSDGGMSGGSCWGGEPSSYGSEEEPDDNLFTQILEKYGEHLSYVNFRKMTRELLHPYSYGVHEYYGNYSRYRGKAFSLKKIYEALFPDA